VHCSASRVRNVEALLFMADCMSHKKHSGTRYDEPVFVYLVRVCLSNPIYRSRNAF
jgi:hypothetical protein